MGNFTPLFILFYSFNKDFLSTDLILFPSISYYFYIPKNFDYLEFHCPTEEKIGIDEKVICYHNISNLLWKKDVLSAWKKKGVSKTLQILGLTASNLQTFFSIHFFSSHQNNFFSQYVRTIMVTKYHCFLICNSS